MYCRCRHFDFDLDKTLYFFTSGRYEFTNKGADMFIEALARLNYYIKVSRSQLVHCTAQTPQSKLSLYVVCESLFQHRGRGSVV